MKQQDFTMEFMIIMVIVAILGSCAFLGFQDSARLLATINEMRNMVNVMVDIKKGYAGNVSESWQCTPTFADFVSIATFNAAYIGSNLPSTSH